MLLAWTLSAFAARPDAVAFVDGSGHPIRCHHLEGQAALCGVVLAALDEAWSVQVDGLGFAAPLPDGGLGGSDALDVYLAHDGTGGAGGAYVICEGDEADPCVDAVAGDGRASTPTYIVIDPDTPAADLRGYAHHEFNHVCQYATDFEEPFLAVWEGTAVAAEHWTDPTAPLDPGPIADYQVTPWASAVLQDGYWLDETYGIWSWYEYGATVWVRWMDERHGDGAGSLGPALWQAFANDPGENEPDVLDAWDTLGGDWRTDLPDFVRMRARLGTDTQPEWAKSLGVGARIPWEDGATGRVDGEWNASHELFPLGAVFARFEHDGNALSATLADAESFVLVDLDAPDGTPAADHLEFSEAGTVHFAMVSVPGDGFDADDALTGATATLLFGEPSDCGCASAGPGVPWGVLLSVSGAGAAARARPGRRGLATGR